MNSLYERARPTTWAEVSGQERTVKALQRLQERGQLAGNAYWLSGPSGSGKTTLARLIAANAADPWGTEEYSDPSELTAAVIADIRLCCQRKGLYRHCYIVNEIHGAGNALVRKLLGLTETLPPWVTWVFTTTSIAQKGLFEDCVDAGPLLSRCKVFKLEADVQAFADRVKSVAMREGIDGQDITHYRSLLANVDGNMRAALQQVESGEFSEFCRERAAIAEAARLRAKQMGYA